MNTPEYFDNSTLVTFSDEVCEPENFGSRCVLRIEDGPGSRIFLDPAFRQVLRKRPPESVESRRRPVQVFQKFRPCHGFFPFF